MWPLQTATSGLLLICLLAGRTIVTDGKQPCSHSVKQKKVEVQMRLKEAQEDRKVTLEEAKRRPPSPSPLGHYRHAAAASDAQPCARVAVDVLREGGGAADAAVAGLLCIGVINPHSMGLGGGFLLTYYHRASATAFTLDARETAPRRTPSPAGAETREGGGGRGALVGVPGELRGYQELYRRFGGRVPWPRLLEPARRLCKEGHAVSWHMAHALTEQREVIMKESSMRVFMNPATGRLVREGELVRRLQLANTLMALQEYPDALHTGPLARALAQDIQSFGGTVGVDDLRDYRPVWREPARVVLRHANLTVFSSPPPGCGVLAGLALNVLDQYNVTPLADAGRTHRRLVEAVKWAYGQRARLADPAFVNTTGQVVESLSSHAFAHSVQQLIEAAGGAGLAPHQYGLVRLREDHGTSHLSVLAANGDAVGVTSSINTQFGARLRSEKTGVILNSVMLDFSRDDDDLLTRGVASSNNAMQPGKRPRSSMSPTVVVDGVGQVRLVVGASGGSRIPAAVAQVAARALWFACTIKEAIDDRRVYVGTTLDEELYEEEIPREVYQSLRRRAHLTREVPYSDLSVVNAILVTRADPPDITANADYRKRGAVDGY